METKEEEQLGESIVFESFLKEKIIMGIPDNGFYSLLGISVILFLFIKVFAIIPIIIIFIILKVIATKNPLTFQILFIKITSPKKINP